MEIGPTNQAGAPEPAQPPAPESGRGVVSSDFETFLVMLTAQIQNQDPLNPVDSADYAVQLATFSGVEQQVLTNELLRQMDRGGAEDTAASGLLELAGWVGLEAQTEGGTGFSGDPIEFAVAPPADTQWAQLLLRDSVGREVRALAVKPGDGSVTWDGKTGDGARAKNGIYTAELHIYRGGEQPPEILPVTSFAPIVEVRQGAGGHEVVLEGGRVMRPEDIQALRQSSDG